MSSSWFSLSLPNPFNSDDDKSPPQSPTATAPKPGFSTITQTIGRQLHNVATFLAPPPQQPSSSSPPLQTDDSGEASPSSTSSYRGITDDLAEIGGSFKTGLSLLSSNKAVSEISKFASNLLQFDQADDLEASEPVGVNDDVIKFVHEISLRPECWIDFPLSLQHQDFNMSDIQKDHSSIIQQLVPSLTTLKHNILNYMSEQQFWMIYFILLLPRLNEDDHMLLSTPEIVQIREVLLEKLRNKNNTPMDFSKDTNQNEHVNTSLSEKGSEVNTSEEAKTVKTENREDDLSFSDLEDEDNDLSGRFSGIRQTQSRRVSSASETSDWVRLNEQKTSRSRHSESEESSDWQTVGVGDVDF
ncbi:hypothetical protein L2E82_03252 [Cichorium intybus]|uniref:Uncharacterized protein n=1 Tax=Cichorium intybus TaxID=13427 RepID=A0ACB9H4E8_CICIN|nr:hypothetical protein L2E82_03252 [Cichorium intybus]